MGISWYVFFWKYCPDFGICRVIAALSFPARSDAQPDRRL